MLPVRTCDFSRGQNSVERNNRYDTLRKLEADKKIACEGVTVGFCISTKTTQMMVCRDAVQVYLFPVFRQPYTRCDPVSEFILQEAGTEFPSEELLANIAITLDAYPGLRIEQFHSDSKFMDIVRYMRAGKYVDHELCMIDDENFFETRAEHFKFLGYP